MPRLNNRLPKYRLHDHSGQAIVTLNGRDHYLGRYDSEESRREYDRLLAEWLAHERIAPIPAPKQPAVLVNEVILAFWNYAQSYYRKPDGTHSSEISVLQSLLRLLRQYYGHTPAVEFGPRALAALRQVIINRGWCRKSINKHAHRISSVFRYAASLEMIPSTVYQQLKTLMPLKRGRTTAREMPRVRPAPQAMIDAVLGRVSRQVAAIIRLELLTGARSGEIVRLRPMDLQHTAEEIWTAEPQDHKTAHHELTKTIYFGLQAQTILKEYLAGRPMGAYLFSPAEAERERRQRRHAARKTPPQQGNRPGTQRTPSPRRAAKGCYTVASLRRAIQRACEEAYPPPEHLARARRPAKHRPKTQRWETNAEWKDRLGPDRWKELLAWRQAHRWHPHQLRHNAATQIRKEFGVEMARVVIGNRSIPMAELYAEVDDQKARQVAKQLG